MSIEKKPGEIAAIVGYFFQYEIFATEIYNRLLKNELDWVEFASQEAGKLDDVLLATHDTVFAYQTKDIGSSNFTYNEFTRADPESIFHGVFKGWKKIKSAYPDKTIDAKFLTTQSVSEDDRINAFVEKAKPSFEKFVRNFWQPIQRGTYDVGSIPKVWQPVFDELAQWVNASPAELVSFIKDFSFVFNYQLNQFISDSYTQAKRQNHIESITKGIARIISQQGNSRFTRSQFLDTFNLKNQFETRFQHAFFVDEIHYQQITATADALNNILNAKSKGYIALVGNAGSGKSTLLTKWLENSGHHVLKYYAYTNIDMSYDFGYRGEASHFLHDILVQIREKAFTDQDRLPEKDVEDLQIHLAKELKKLASRGEKVVIIVDGLDHIEREQQIARSLISVLPQPVAIPENIYFILGSRTIGQLKELSFDIQQELDTTCSIVTIAALSKTQVRGLADSYQLQLTDNLLEALYENTLGHPLFLRYTIEELRSADPTQYKEIILAKKFQGDIYTEYQRFWQQHKNYDAFVHILGLISRFRYPYFDLNLLSHFSIKNEDAERVNKLAEFYFYKSGNIWQFFHNSFKEFLIEESAKNRFSIQFELKTDHAFHTEIADTIASIDDLYRYNYLYHLYKSGNFRKITEIADQAYFRKQWFDFRNSSIIREDIRLAAQSGLKEKDYKTIAECFFAFMEIDQRVANFSQAEHYDLYLAAGWLDIASSFVFDSARLLVSPAAALDFSSRLHRKGHQALAFELFNRASPAQFLNAQGKLSRRRHDPSTYTETDEIQLMETWVTVASLFLTISEVIDAVKNLVIQPEGYDDPEEPFLPRAIMALKDFFIENGNEQKLDELSGHVMATLDGYDRFDFYYDLLRNHMGGEILKKEALAFFAGLQFNQMNTSHLIRYAIIYTRIDSRPDKRLAAFQKLEKPAELKARIKPHAESALANYIYHYTNLLYITQNDFSVEVASFVPQSEKSAANAYNIAFAELGKADAWIFHGANEAAGGFLRNIERWLSMFHYSFNHPAYDVDIMYAKDELAKQILEVSLTLSRAHSIAVLQKFKKEWETYRQYWSPKIIQSVLSWVVDHELDDAWCTEILISLEDRIYLRGYLQERIDEGVTQANLWAKIGNQQKVQETLSMLMSICLDVGPEDDYQVDHMVKWIVKFNPVPVQDIQWYLDRLPSMLNKVNSQLHTPALQILELTLPQGNGYTVFEHLLFEKLVNVLDALEAVLIYLLPLLPDARNTIVQLFARIIIAMDDAHSTRRRFIRAFFALNPSSAEVTILVEEVKIYAMTEMQHNYLLEIQKQLKDTDIGPKTVGFDEVLRPKDEDHSSSGTLRLKDGRSFSNEELLVRVSSMSELLEFKKLEEQYKTFNWTDLLIKVIPATDEQEIANFLSDFDLDTGTDHILHIVRELDKHHKTKLAKDFLIRTIQTSRYCQWGNNYYNSGKLPAYQQLSLLQDSKTTAQMVLQDFVDTLPNMGVQAKSSLIDQLDEVFTLFDKDSSKEMLYASVNIYRDELLRSDQVKQKVPVKNGKEKDQVLLAQMLFFLITTPSQFEQIIYPILIQHASQLGDLIYNLMDRLFVGGYTLKFLHLLSGLAHVQPEYIQKYKTQLKSFIGGARFDTYLMAMDLLAMIDEEPDRAPQTTELPLSYTLELSPQVGLVGTDQKPVEHISKDGYLKETNDPVVYTQIIRPEIAFIARVTGINEYNIAYRIRALADELQFPEWCKTISEQELRALYESTLDLKIPYNRPDVQKVYTGLAKVTMELFDLNYLTFNQAVWLQPYFDPALYNIKTIARPIFVPTILRSSGSAPSVDKKWPHQLTETYVDEVIHSFADGKYILAERTVLEGMGHGKATEVREAFASQPVELRAEGPFFPFRKQMLIENYPDLNIYGIVVYNSALTTNPEANWLALNPLVAADLELTMKQDNGNFVWTNKNGETVAESIFWRLGNPANKAGHHDSEAGCGWLVTITEEGFKAILDILGDTPLLHYKTINRNLEFVQERYGTYIDETNQKTTVNPFNTKP